MASPRIEYAVLPAGEGPGQDRCFTADGLVVVLDGASAYDPSVRPDASEYVDTLGLALIEQITGSPDIDLRDALAEAIRQSAEKLHLIAGKGPSSTVSVVRWGDATVDVLILGDSPVVVQFTDGTSETLVQHPMDHIAPELRKLYRERLAAGCGYDEEHRAILAEIQRVEASYRNRDAGYFIAETEPKAASAANYRHFTTVDVSAVAVITDGVLPSCFFEDIQSRMLLTWSGPQIEQLLRTCWSWEENDDPAGVVFPRSMRHDDKTFAIMRL